MAGKGIVAVPGQVGGDGSDGQGRHDQYDVPLDRTVEPGLALVQARAVLPVLKRQRSPAALISRVLVSNCPSGT